MTAKCKMSRFFKRAGRSFWLADRLTMFVAVVVLSAVLTGVVANAGAPAGGGSTAVNTNVGGTDMTISKFSEIISAAFASNVSESVSHKGMSKAFMDTADQAMTSNTKAGPSQLSLGNVGNVLGYIGVQSSASNTSNFWTDGSDASSKMITLESIAMLHSEGGSFDSAQDAMAKSSIAQYVVWGAALNSMGIDEFRNANVNSDGIRSIIGYTSYVLFILAYTAGSIMTKVVEFLQNFNVFMWVWNGIGGAVSIAADKILGTNDLTTIPLIKEIYSALTVMKWLRWVLYGMLVLFFVASITVWKQAGYNRAAGTQQRLRRLLYRLIIMCIGIPLCGAFYTECIDVIGRYAKDTHYVLTSYVLQEFMDFEGWTVGSTSDKGVMTSFKTTGLTNTYKNMYVEYSTNGDRFTIRENNKDGDIVDISKLVYAINGAVHGSDVTGSNIVNVIFANTLFGKPADGSDPPDYYDLVENAESAENMTGIDAEKAYNTCRDLLLRYARSSTVTPDRLNRYYLEDMLALSDALPGAADGAGADAYNQAAAMNATVLEQLFGENASEQRVWSFYEPVGDGKWIYRADDGISHISMLDSTLDNGTPMKVEVELSGLACSASRASGSGNTVKVNNTPIMGATLSNSGPGVIGVITVDRNVYAKDGAVEMVENGTAEAGAASNYKYAYTYDLSVGGMSPLALYNYMHSKFDGSELTVYSPKLTTNAGVGTMHYAVTTPYSGIPELVQLLFILSVLFSFGIIGWVFGVSLLVNAIVQMVKAFPIMFKMMMGSVQGFVEGLLIVFSVCAEMVVTIALYSLSAHIIDFLIRLVRNIVKTILEVFGTDAASAIDPESYAIVAGLLSTALILWGTFNLIKWRVAITLSIKSMITHVMNQVFGTSAAMPTGASSGMMKAAAGLAAGGMIAGALAEDGALDDVVNDLTQSDLGSSLHEKISEGDWDGAMQDVRAYANGEYVSEDADGDIDRGKNDSDWAQERLGDGADSLDGTFGMQSLTDEQQAELDEKYKDDALAAAEKLDEARKDGDPDKIRDAQEEFDDIMQARAADAAEMRAENGRKARELGVADYGDYLRAQADDAESMGLAPVEGADIPDDPGKELTSDGQAAYDAARDGDAETLRSMAGKYDANGLTEEQQELVNQAVKDGKSEAEIADMVEGFAEENFGEHHAAVVDKMNEAARRTSGALYGSADNSDGDARTVAVASGHDESGARTYGVKDNSSDEGAKTFTTNADGSLSQEFDTMLPEDPGQRLSAENQDVYDAALDGDQDALAAAADRLDENGLTAEQADEISEMVASGATAEQIAEKTDEFARSNLGDNHKAVMERVNAAAGRGSSAEYGDPMGGRTVSVRAKSGSLDGSGTDWGIKDGGDPGSGEKTLQTDAKGVAHELPTAISDAPSKALTSENQSIFEAARDGDTMKMQQMAGYVNGQGLNHEQEQAIRGMVESGASNTEIAAAIDNFAQDNFGDDYKQVIDKMNQAAGRDGTVTYSTPTGGGPDGSQPRSVEVSSGYANGGAAYSVGDPNDPDSMPSMIQASDSDGQSVYTDITGGKSGEQIVTSDFGSRAGQTYGSIRNEVDAVANASGGLLQRGSGAGDWNKTTVSEAASEIASRQSMQGVAGRAQAKVGDSAPWAGGADMNNFNRAAAKAAENSGIAPEQLGGIAGGVSKATGEAVTEAGQAALPTAGTAPGLNATGPAGGINVGGQDGRAALIASEPVDSYGRSQAAGAIPGASPAPSVTEMAPAPGEGISYGKASDPMSITPMSNGSVAVADIPVAGTAGAGSSGAAGVADVVAGNGNVNADIPLSGQGTMDLSAPAAPVSGNVQAQAAQAIETAKSKIDLPTGIGMAAAAATFVKTGSLSSAASTYMGTERMVSNIIGDDQTQQPAASGAGGAPAQGQPQVQTQGQVQTQDQQQIQYQAPSPATVEIQGMGSMPVVRGNDGAVYTAGANGAATAQKLAMTSSGTYVPVTQTTDGKTVASGGQPAVQLTDGSYVTVTQNDKGQTVLSDSEGKSSGTILTQTAGGWQPAVTASNGVTYSVDESGQATGAVTVMNKDGGSVSVVKSTDGSVRMANPDGSASRVKMAVFADGTYGAINAAGHVTTGGAEPKTVQAARMDNGSQTVIVEHPMGGFRVANSDGTPSMNVVRQNADGTWTQASRTETIETIQRTVTETVPNPSAVANPYAMNMQMFDTLKIMYGQQGVQLPDQEAPAAGPAAPAGGIPSVAQQLDQYGINLNGDGSGEGPGWGTSGSYNGGDDR